MNERIRKLRKHLDLTQEAFGEKIGVKRNTIATYEMGRSEPSNAAVSLICKTFGVNEKWLRYGEGEMFVPKTTDALDSLVKERGLTHGDQIVIEKFLNLNPETRASLVNYFIEVAAALNNDDVDPLSPAYPGAKVVDAEALYEKSLGFAPNTASSALSITDDTGSDGKAAGNT